MPVTVDYIVEAVASLGGKAHLSSIVSRVREIAGGEVPRSLSAVVRARIEERSSDSESFKGKDDLFFSVHGVNARKGWWGLRSDPLNVSNPDAVQDEAEADFDDTEGAARLHIHLRRERSRKLIQQFKSRLTSFRCAVCDFDFERTYGTLGERYIEAHHTIPVADLQPGATTNIRDLVAVCSNCHRMLHRKGLMDWRALREAVLSTTRDRNT